MPPKVRQISIFLENRVGRLMEATKALSREAINILGISVVEVSDFGIIRLVVDAPDEALAALGRIGLVATEQEVLAVELTDGPGSLAQLLTLLVQAELSVQYTYGLLEKSRGRSVIVLRVGDVDGAGLILDDSGFHLLSHYEVAGLGRGPEECATS